MPTKCGQKDSKGYFCRWGSSGKKYYYTKGDKKSMERARKKADKQGAAAHASGYRGSDKSDLLDSASNILSNISKSLNDANVTSKIEDKSLIQEEVITEAIEPSGNIDEEPRTDIHGEEILTSKSECIDPESVDELLEGHIIRYNGKIGKIIRIVE